MKKIKTDEDRISTLPDELLHQILSFLDMKQVVHTSLLSSRWRYLWISLSNLNFDEEFWLNKRTYELKREEFRDFVDEVLISCNSSTIDKFSLSICHDHDVNQIFSAVHDDSDRIDTWITYLVMKNVQEVHISAGLVLPITIGLLASQVKSLHLESSILWGDDSIDLLMNFPVLEKLSIVNCQYMFLTSITISAPQLKYLFVESYYAYAESCKIKIRAPNLTSLKLEGHMYETYTLENLYSLVTAEVHKQMDWYKVLEKKVIGRCLSKLLKGLANAKFLTFSVRLLQAFPELPSMLGRAHISLHNVRHLTLTSLYNNDYIRPVAKLLEIFPHLETLVLERTKVSFNKYKGDGNWGAQLWFLNELNRGGEWGAQLSFQCMFFHLKCIEVWELEGCDNELKFLEFLMRNALALEKITIKTTEALSKDKEEELVEFSKNLKFLSKASPKFKISLMLKKGTGMTVVFEDFSSSSNPPPKKSRQ